MSNAAKRYAPALLDAALGAGQAEAVEKDVNVLLNLVASSPEFVGFLTHPLIPAEKQIETLDALFAGKLGELTLNFLKLLAQRGRLSDAPDVLSEAFDTLQTERGLLTVGITSAVPFTEAQENALRDKLAARSGKTILFETVVDESLIGGFRLRIGDRVEDYSLSTKLETFKRNVINA